MTGLWLFLHFLGFVMWIGGGFASMHAGLSAKGEPRPGLGAITRAQARIQKTVIAPGALLVVLSGLIASDFDLLDGSGQRIHFRHGW